MEHLPQRAADLLRGVEAGEEVAISRLGAVVARLVPVTPERASPADRVDWTQSAALRMDKGALPCLSAEGSLALIKDAGGRY